MTCNTFDSIGSKFSPRILTPEQARARLTAISSRVEYQENAATRHDMRLLGSALGVLLVGDYSQRPILSESIAAGELTPSKFADFVEWAAYESDEVVFEIARNDSGTSQHEALLDLLEAYLDPGYAKAEMGNTCVGIVNKLAQIVGFLSSGARLISELKNFTLSGLVDQLLSWKDKLISMVDELVPRMLTKLENVVKSILTFTSNAVSRLLKKAEAIKKFLSESSIEELKASIESIIAKIAGQFEDMTPEAITHILMVICQLADSIVSFIHAPIDFLGDAVRSYLMREAAVKAFSYDQITKSTESGIARMDPRDITPIVNTAASNSTGKLMSKSMTDEERSVIAQLLKGGSATSGGVTISHSAQTVAREKNKTGGWTFVLTRGEPMLYVILYRIARVMGENMTVTCAYRNEAAQKEIKARGGHPAKNSLHTTGLALDVSMSGFTTTQKAKFIDLASAQGIGGIQYYPADNFTHIDLGQVRWWPNDAGVGGENAIPEEIRAAEYRHIRGIK